MKKATVISALMVLAFSAACSQNAAVEAADPDVKLIPRSFKKVAKKVKPSVVNVSTLQVLKRRSSPYGGDPFFSDDFFERFFGVPKGDLKRRSLGSGTIVHKDGYILTNNHVVARADEITVKLFNEDEREAEVIGTDPETDLAVIKIDAGGLTPAELGNSDAIEVGDWVLAMGSPFGLEQTVTQGIISAKGRIIGAGPYDDFLQTDAAINPGNSGGPLVDLSGRVIGINTAISSTSGGYEGVGFAIPITMARKVYNDIVKQGKVTRGWLGVGIQELTPELAKHFGVKKGVLISQVFDGSPAEKAGIKRGDVVVEFGGERIDDFRALQAKVAETEVGKKVKVKVVRGGSEKTLRVKTAERDIEKAAGGKEYSRKESGLGIIAGNITPEAARQFGIKAKEGAVVLSVTAGSPADSAGVMRGDVIHEVNGKRVHNLNEFESRAEGLKKGDEVVFLIERGNSMVYLAFTVE